MASAILILLWIQNQVSHDRFYKNTGRIYMMYNRDKFDGRLQAWNNTPKPMAPALKQDYPEVQDAVRYTNVNFLVTVGDKHLNVRGAFADSGFLSVFSFPLLKGECNASLNRNYSIVLTERLAKKLFGNDEAIGHTVRIDTVDNFTVSAVLKDLPNNTQFDFEYLLPWTYRTKLGWEDTQWGNNSVYTYALLKPGASQTAFDAKVKNITIQHITEGQPSTTEVFTAV